MKKRTEHRSAETPVDALFARKLSDTSLTPAAGSFERLQTRLGQQAPSRPASLWRTPAVQRYAAVAACLLLMAAFGWLYRDSGSTRQPATAVKFEKSFGLEQPLKKSQHSAPSATKADERQATATSTVAAKTARVNQPVELRAYSRIERRSQHSPVNPTISAGSNDYPSNLPTGTVQPSEERIAETSPKPETPAQRVLIVTIEEPAVLVAARQAAQLAETTKMEAVANVHPEKGTKVMAVWQQVKRLRQGEIMARRTGTDDERNLLNRAYNGLRQTLEKDKPSKQ